MEANDPPLGMRTRLSLKYCVKLISNEVNPAYSAVFQSDIVSTYGGKKGLSNHWDYGLRGNFYCWTRGNSVCFIKRLPLRTIKDFVL